VETLWLVHVTPASWLCPNCLNRLRADFVAGCLNAHHQELSDLHHRLNGRIRRHQHRRRIQLQRLKREMALPERLADRLAHFCGSWGFLGVFFLAILGWVLLNETQPFDPYPYLLLTLILSMLAAIQAPIILMSQNRLMAEDRTRAERDHHVNQRAELELQLVHEKLDQVLMNLGQTLLLTQQVQTELLNDILHYHAALKNR
jgi:uncharacterized membrane protein